MPVLFKLSCRGLSSINRNALSKPAELLLLKVLYHHGQQSLTMEQLFDYLDMERKTAARLLYKMLHAEWLINIEENQVSTMLEEDLSEHKKTAVIASLLPDVVNDNHIILSDQQGLMISALGFSSELGVYLAANAAECIKKHVQTSPESADEETIFPVFTNLLYQEMDLECRLIQVNGLCFIITTKNTSVLNKKLYFDLISNLLRRYGSE